MSKDRINEFLTGKPKARKIDLSDEWYKEIMANYRKEMKRLKKLYKITNKDLNKEINL